MNSRAARSKSKKSDNNITQHSFNNASTKKQIIDAARKLHKYERGENKEFNNNFSHMNQPPIEYFN